MSDRSALGPDFRYMWQCETGVKVSNNIGGLCEKGKSVRWARRSGT